MVVRALCAAAAVVVGAGSAANAASIHRFDMVLRYEGTYYDNISAGSFGDDGIEFYYDKYFADGNPFGIPVLDPHLNVGDETTFKATLSIPKVQNQIKEGNYYDNGGRALNCRIAGLDCGYISTVYYSNDRLDLGIDESMYSSLTSGFKVGSSLDFTFNLGYSSFLALEQGSISFHN